MRNFVLSCLLCTATVLLMNQQTILVEAKPFLLLPANFFVLTTRAPCTSSQSQDQSNCNSSPSSSSSSSTSSSFQIPDLISPKLRLLSTLLQGLGRRGSSSGGISGGFGFAFNKLGAKRPSSSSTTTTSSPDQTTEPGAVFEPESSENTGDNGSSSSSTSSSIVTTTESSTSVSSTSGPGYDYEKNGISAGISASVSGPGKGVSTSVQISNRLGTEDTDTGDKGKTGNSVASGGQGYSYQSSSGTSNGGSNGGTAVNSGYQYNSNKNENVKSSSTAPSGGVAVSAGYQYGNEKTTVSATQRSGYQYSRPADNEVGA